jgi:hypothetical protein
VRTLLWSQPLIVVMARPKRADTVRHSMVMTAMANAVVKPSKPRGLSGSRSSQQSKVSKNIR